jgi:hypothetical protein
MVIIPLGLLNDLEQPFSPLIFADLDRLQNLLVRYHAPTDQLDIASGVHLRSARMAINCRVDFLLRQT